MKTQKYKLKAKARVGGKWLDAGTEVELTPDQIERLEKTAAEAEKQRKQEAK